MIVLLLVLFGLWFEVTLTTLPLLLIIVTVLVILYRDIWVFGAAFLGGIILDSATVRPLGATSMFLVCWLFLILLYERKYNIDSVPFVVVSSFFGGLIFLYVFGYETILLQSIIGSLLALLLFTFLRRGDRVESSKFKVTPRGTGQSSK